MQHLLNTVTLGNNLELIKQLPDGSIDAIITDPPYPYVKRPYGYWAGDDWLAMMKPLVMECRRALKPNGSSVFILQPNSEKIGNVRSWLWHFMAWCCDEWNMVQDVWWWNITAPPNEHTRDRNQLLRPSMKPCIWLGAPDCYRNQDEVLLFESESNKIARLSGKLKATRVIYPSGFAFNHKKTAEKAQERGGTTPFNVLPIANADSQNSAGANGHGAGTPYNLCLWWIKYITKPGDIVLDPFSGMATVGRAALDNGRNYIGFEKMPEYVERSNILLQEVINEPRQLGFEGLSS